MDRTIRSREAANAWQAAYEPPRREAHVTDGWDLGSENRFARPAVDGRTARRRRAV